GRVDDMHPWEERLRHLGIAQGELAIFRESPCSPDIIGINHYVTSDRYLHDDRERFPPAFHGGNGRDVYADVEAVRIPDVPAPAIETLLIEAWERYRLPIAITEAHMGCTREEQLRWI